MLDKNMDIQSFKAVGSQTAINIPVLRAVFAVKYIKKDSLKLDFNSYQI